MVMLLLPFQRPDAEAMNPGGLLVFEQCPAKTRYTVRMAQNKRTQPQESRKCNTCALLTVSGAGRGRRGL